MVDPRVAQRSPDHRTELGGNQNKARFARLIKVVMNQPLIASAGLQQRRPGLGFLN
jgi:hypothetical protein